MGRQKDDGRGKTGGRQKGTPNKIPGELKKRIAEGLAERVDKYFDNLDQMELPTDYCSAYGTMARTILPKESQHTIETGKTIEDLLAELCEEHDED